MVNELGRLGFVDRVWAWSIMAQVDRILKFLLLAQFIYNNKNVELNWYGQIKLFN